MYQRGKPVLGQTHALPDQPNGIGFHDKYPGRGQVAFDNCVSLLNAFQQFLKLFVFH